MPDHPLRARVDAEIAEFRRSLLDIAMKAQRGLLDVQDEVLISRILIGCRLILDRVMNAVWAAHNNQKPGSKKANVYFPSKSSAEAFDAELQKSQLGELRTANAAAYDAIRARQPFETLMNLWLQELFDLTKDKHESYVEIESKRDGEMRIGEGQSGHVRRLAIMKDGRVLADADMIDSGTGKRAPLRLTFIERFNHLLCTTNHEPRPGDLLPTVHRSRRGDLCRGPM